MPKPSSGEVGCEAREHLAHYVVMNMSQPVGNGHAYELPWDGLAETYAEGGCALHVHFRAGVVGSGVAGDWCAIFNRAEHWLDVIHRDVHGDGEAKRRQGRGNRGVRQPVLVNVGKPVELPQGIVSGFLASVARLQPLDFCLRGWGDAPEHLMEIFRVLAGKDGELGLPRELARQRFPLVGDGEFVGEVVECGAEVVQAIPDDEAKIVSGWGVEDLDPEELLAGINIGFGPSLVRVFFLYNPNFRFKAPRVVERPVEPPLVVEAHGRSTGDVMAGRRDKPLVLTRPF